MQGPNFARSIQANTAQSTQDAWGNGDQRSTYRIRRFGAGSDSRAGGKVEKEKRKVRRHVSISYLRGISKAAIRTPTYG